MSTNNNATYFFTTDPVLVTGLDAVGIEPVYFLPLFTLDSGYADEEGVGVYLKSQKLKDAIADLLVAEKLYDWEETNVEPMKPITPTQLVY